MTVAEIVAIIILALLIGALFFFGLRRSGPWGTFWSFVLILFLGMWLFDIWVAPFGPLYWGIAWFDLLLIGFLLALLLAAASPTPPPGRETVAEETQGTGGRRTAAAVVGTFFWLLMLMFIVLLLIGIFT